MATVAEMRKDEDLPVDLRRGARAALRQMAYEVLVIALIAVLAAVIGFFFRNRSVGDVRAHSLPRALNSH